MPITSRRIVPSVEEFNWKVSQMERYIACALQFEPAWGEKERNLERLATLIAEAARQGARLVVAPEMATTGYIFSSPGEIASLVEPVPGPTTAVLGELAREHGIYLVLGLPEVDAATGFFYNTAVLINPQGEVVGRYRKTHAFPPDTRWAVDGDLGFPVFPTAVGRLGMAICMDADYFETARLLALAGAEVVAFPSNWLGHAPSNVWRARALENGLYWVAADRWGSERGTTFAGGSCIIDPRGQVLAFRERGDGLVLAEIDLVRVRGHVLNERRPRAYYWLALNSYLWTGDETFSLPAGGEFLVAVFQGAPAASCLEARAKMQEWIERAVGYALQRGLGELASLVARTPVWPAPPAEEDQREKRGSSSSSRPLPEESNRVFAPIFVFPGDFFPVSRNEVKTALAEVGALARRLGIYLAFGLTIEEPFLDSAGRRQGGSRSRPAAALVGPEGEEVMAEAVHSGEEPDSPPVSDPFSVLDLPGVRVGLVAGRDLFFPETVRILAKKGADLVLAPSAWAQDEEIFLWAERAAANDVYLAVANLSPPWGAGASAIYGDVKKKERLTVLEKEGWVWLKVRTTEDSFCRRKEMLRKLRTQWYGPLAQITG